LIVHDPVKRPIEAAKVLHGARSPSIMLGYAAPSGTLLASQLNRSRRCSIPSRSDPSVAVVWAPILWTGRPIEVCLLLAVRCVGRYPRHGL